MKSLKLQDGNLFYEEKGSGPSLVLLHAGIADSRMWQAQFDPFAEHFHTVRCDLRGYGRSPIPDGPFSYTEDVLALVEALDLTSVWLIGASFGAKVAVDFCLSHPSRVRGLVLVGPVVSGFEPSGEVEQFNQQEDALLDDGKLEEATELNLRMWVDGPYRTSEEVDPRVRNRIAEMQLNAFSQPVPENASVLRLSPPAIDRLDEIQIPLLVISGGLDVPSFVQFSEVLVNRVPGAKRAVIPDAAHMVSMEVPEVFNQLVLEFISTSENSV
jgi:3-oxoadipate enol-lactonase